MDEGGIDHRYYDFRSQLRVVDETAWLPRFEQITRAWLAEKGYELNGDPPAARTEDSFEVRLDEIKAEDSSAVRLTLVERREQGEWRTEVLALDDARFGGWISVVVHNSEGQFGSRPRLVPRLLESIDVLDGHSELVDDTWIIRAAHLQEFLDVLGDPDRRAPVFVTAAAPGANLSKVRSWMSDRSRELAGLAHSYVLDAESNALLMRGLGPAMGVRPGTIRSFAPAPAAHDPADALRHKVIGAARLESTSVSAARALVGRIARFEAAAHAEPDALRDMRRAFDRKAVDDRYRPSSVLRESPLRPRAEQEPARVPDSRPRPPAEQATPGAHTPTSTPQSPPVSAASPAVEPKDGPASAASPVPQDSASPAHPTVPAPPSTDQETARVQIDLLLSLMNSTTLDEAVVEARTMRALLDEAAEEAQRILADRDRYADSAIELELAVDGLERELSHEINRRRTAEQNTRLLTLYQEPAQADGERPVHPLDLEQPEQFSDIPAALPALEQYIVFTGKPREVEELDEYDLNRIGAKRCWEGITALFDYARARAEGVHRGDLHTYLMTTPANYAGFPAGQYAGVESESTKGRREFEAQRRLPVPTHVHQSGSVVMWAHLKLKQIGRISPRLHFYDDVAGSGKVYIGYIGRHLGISSD